MANFSIRTIDSIFQELLTEKDNFTTLSALSSGSVSNEQTLVSELEYSDVNEWVLWLYNFAVATHLTDISMNTAVTDIQTELNSNILATDKWWISQVLNYQHGDSLVLDVNTYKPSYLVIDETKRIIQSCTTFLVQNKVYLKVRRKDTDTLSNDELLGLTNYCNTIKPAGTRILIQNFDGDLITLNFDIVYSALYSLIDIQTNVETAINNYLSSIEYDSRISINKLIDILQQIPGVIDQQFNGGVAINSLLEETSFEHEYITNAGWAQVNPSTPLSTTINYLLR